MIILMTERRREAMIHIIPAHRLSAGALRGVIEEFISRSGTDYGAADASMETKFKHAKASLLNGSVVLVFDDETKTTNMFRADDPVLKKISALSETTETQEAILAEMIRPKK